MSTIKVDNIDSKDSTGNITVSRPIVATLTAGSINNLNNLLTPANASVTAAKMATTDTLPAWSGINLTALNANNLGSGTVSRARGGTGLTTAGASGQVLTSDGTNWTSAAAGGGFTLLTPATTTSGTSVPYAIPSGTTTVRVMFENHSQNTDLPILIRLGDSGGIETSGYYSGRSYLVSAADYGPNNGTEGFGIKMKSATDNISGHIDLSLLDSSNFIWVASGVLYANSERFFYVAGSKALNSVLTQIEIQTWTGSYAFDSGSVNIMYQ